MRVPTAVHLTYFPALVDAVGKRDSCRAMRENLAQSVGSVVTRTASATKVKTLTSGVWRTDGAVCSASECRAGV